MAAPHGMMWCIALYINVATTYIRFGENVWKVFIKLSEDTTTKPVIVVRLLCMSYVLKIFVVPLKIHR